MTRNKKSPAPGSEQTGDKAWWTAVAMGVATFAAYWVADTGQFRTKEILEAALFALTASGLGGFGTFKIPNRPKQPKRR